MLLWGANLSPLFSRWPFLVIFPSPGWDDSSEAWLAWQRGTVLAYPGATIYECGPEGVRRLVYEETEHFRVTRDFLNRYPAMLRTLFAQDDPAG